MSPMRPMAFLAPLLALPIATAALAQDPPHIFAGNNGEIEATFTNNCVVYYNADGQRRESNPNCTRDQVIKADQGVAGYRKEQGMEGYSGSEAPPGGYGGSRQYAGVPEVVVDDHGRGHVNVGNLCTIYYDRQGRYNDQSGQCSHHDRSAADKAIAAYRREQGEAHGSSRGYYSGVSVYHFKNGNFQATQSDGCTVYFSSKGALLTATSKCDSGDKARAAVAVYQFRKEHPEQ